MTVAQIALLGPLTCVCVCVCPCMCVSAHLSLCVCLCLRLRSHKGGILHLKNLTLARRSDFDADGARQM